jgi:hypothetical protein
VSKDISHIIAGWDHVPDSVSVRIIPGDDGRDKIQMRLDLGLMQMEMDGRPDGLRPEGCESWLDYFEQQQAECAARGESDDFALDAEQCSQLLREGIQYYHRYLSFWNLGRYDLCARDTKRNLRLFAFVRQHARRQRDRLQFDQWRPYVIMMHTRSVAMPSVEAGNYPAALATIDAGIGQIRDFLQEYNQQQRADKCAELSFLVRWREELEAERSKAGKTAGSVLEKLQRELAEAVAIEHFEEAARLRDEIRQLLPQSPPPPPQP